MSGSVLNENLIAELKLSLFEAEDEICDKLQEYFSSEITHQSYLKKKAFRDLQVSADVQSDSLITEILKRRFPSHEILSEETDQERDIDSTPWTWLIDPLCGSNNFYFGLPNFGVSICLLYNEAPIYGALFIPVLAKKISAIRGHGLRSQFLPYRPIVRLAGGLVLYDNQLSALPDALMNLSSVAEKSFAVRISGSAAWDCFMITTGIADVRIFHGTKAFDFLAAQVIIEEMGGAIVDFSGKPVTSKSTKVIVARSRDLADEVLAVIGTTVGI